MLSCLTLAACGSAKESGPPADVIEYELFPSTREVTPAQLEALTSSDEEGVIVFAEEPPGFEDLEPGQVLLAQASEKLPAGLLRVVGSVERDGGVLTLRTGAAPLQAAFRKLHVKMQRDATIGEGRFTPAAGMRNVVRSETQGLTVDKGKGEQKRRFEIIVFDGDDDPETKNNKVEIDALLGGGYTYEISLDIEWGEVWLIPAKVSACMAAAVVGDDCNPEDFLPELRSTFTVDPYVFMDVNVWGAATLDFKKELDVGKIELTPILLFPLVFMPTVDIVASVEGGASARFEVGVAANAELETSVTVSTKTGGVPVYAPPKLKDWHFDPRPPVVDLHASAEAKVGARLGISLYGMAGPYARMSGVARIDAAPLENPCWKLHFALESELGARITTPRLPFVGYVKLLDWHIAPFRPIDEEVDSGACILPPDPPNPPGSGPTPSAFRSPPFPPWSKNLGGDVDATFAPPAGDFLSGAPDLVPAIDGRWIASGSFANALHKIDGNGSIVWTSRLANESGLTLRPLRSVPAYDAGVLALLRPEAMPDSFVLAHVEQSGKLSWARGYELPASCNAEATHLMRDASTGFVVLGRCKGSGDGWMIQVSERGEIVRARTLAEEGAIATVPTAGTVADGELVVAGTLVHSGGEPEWAFASRFDADGEPGVSTTFTCASRVAMAVTAAAPSENGGVTLVGEANGPGLVARLRKDGGVGFVRFPNLGIGTRDWFSVSSVAELPVTGMVFAASTRKTAETAPPSLVVAGLDGAGRTMWSRGFSLDSRTLTWPALRLTDDGGVFLSAVAGPEGGREGDLFAMKLHAKDGNVGDGSAVASEEVALADYDCMIDSKSFQPMLGALDVTTRTVTLHRQ
ncbi:hypothetical protein AKJ08_0704 [Vulgatibacter incomptus]|uniref:Uncharacterized protein n=1 Tax=Vulgatibacter incomptus TaxID=1391653 RepID=A0A0K1P9Y8_9BACT|nr:hypothetical protein AKJ08_0704 [Vulgatibacter incomptus]